MMQGCKLAGLAGLAGIVASLAPVPASAVTISGGSAGLTSTLTDYNQVLGTLRKFDSNLGTLTSVSFSVGYSFRSTITVTATTASSGSVKTESGAQFSSSDSGVSNVLDTVVNTTFMFFGAQSLVPAAYDLTGNASIYRLPSAGSSSYVSSASAANTYTSSQSDTLASLSDAGGSAFQVLAATLTGTIVQQSGGNATATQRTLADQFISISYDYIAAVPEPASLAMLAAGLLGFGLIRRRA